MGYLLNRKVLLLNQSFEPLMIIGAKRAILLIFSEKVETIENYRELIHSAYLSMKLPSVIRLKHYARIQKKNIVLTRKNILKRDNYTCQYCNTHSHQRMTIDHIVPRNKGGRDTWENLVTACMGCNTKKGNHLLHEIEMKLVLNPKKPTIISQFQKHVKQYQDMWRPYLFMEKN